MKIVVSGASGLIGRRLVSYLRDQGNEISILVRRPASAGEMRWYPDQGVLHEPSLEGIEAAVHLSGENIAGGRWTAARKRRILDSRVESTRLLAECLARLNPRPKVFVCASAIGFYGNRGDEPLEEDAAPGSGYLAEVCQAWEAATQAASDAGIRVVRLRIGVVLSRWGGALARMLTPFRLGLGGRVGNGRQYISWIKLDDVVAIAAHGLTDDSLQGAVNAVAPNPVTNRAFTKALGRVLHRPTLCPLPAFAARLAFGEMADALLLASTRVIPRKLIDSGFQFRHSELELALRHCLIEPREAGMTKPG